MDLIEFIREILTPMIWVCGLLCIPIAAWFHRVITVEDIEQKLNTKDSKRPYGVRIKEIVHLISLYDGEKERVLKKCLLFRRLSWFFLILGLCLMIILPFVD
jgi:hypothetical protein